jgi:hypothetical protein
VIDRESWVCGNCLSINAARSDRCYSCRSPRTMAIDPTVATPTSKVIGDESPLEERAEIARRAGAAYESSAPLATLVRLAVAVATIATLGMVVFDIWAVRQDPGAGESGWITWLLDPEASSVAEVAWLGLVVTVAVAGVWLGAFAIWGWWLSRVVANVPALGGGWTGTGPVAAFISAVVPVSNLVWGTAVLRDALVRLSPPEGARLSLLTAWWMSLVLAILPWVSAVPQAGAVRFVFRLVGASFAGIVSAIPGIEMTGEDMVEVIAGLLMILAATLAVSLVDHVENLQEVRAKALPAPAPA